MSTRPTDAVICPICKGAKETPTKTFFVGSGRRAAGMMGFCMTCKGRGWITQKDFDEAKARLE